MVYVATMKEVARLAGVSTATVSAVINNTAFVSDELEERVRAAIAQLDYRPNALARGLKSNRTRLLSVMVSNITNPAYPEVVQGAEDVASKAGYHILVCSTANDKEKERIYMESMLEHQVEGMLVATIEEPDNPFLQEFKAKNIPLVLINRCPEGYTGSAVMVDNFTAGLLATRHLISLGHEEISFVGAQNLLTSRHREAGYKSAMQEAGLTIPEHLIRYCDYEEQPAYLEFKKMAENGNVPKAVYVGNDLMAFGVIRALLEEGYKVPEDVSIIGCDNIEFSSKFIVPLTTVHLPKYELGKLGAEMLLRAINSESRQLEAEFIQLKPHLVVRKSCR